MAKLIGKSALNGIVAHQEDVQDKLEDKAKRGEDLAERNLSVARSTTQWHKIIGPSHLTHIEVGRDKKYTSDWLVTLVAVNTGKGGGGGNVAMSLEFGHDPSGIFEGTDTHAPDGLYILTQAVIAI